MSLYFSFTRYHKKLRIWASTESLLKLSDLEYSYEFLKGSITIFMFSLIPVLSRIFQNNVIFHKKLRIWASTESLLKLSDLKYSYEFLKGSITIFMFSLIPVLSRIFQNNVIFHKKLRIWASTESLLKLSDLEYSYEFLKGSITIFMFSLIPDH